MGLEEVWGALMCLQTPGRGWGSLPSPPSRAGDKRLSDVSSNRKLFPLFFKRKARDPFPGVIPALPVPYISKHFPGLKISF